MDFPLLFGGEWWLHSPWRALKSPPRRKWLSLSISLLKSSFVQTPFGQYAEMMSIGPRSWVWMEMPTASIESELVMLRLVKGIDLLMRMATPPPCLSALFLLITL
jgi:hypothetical protein